MFKNRYDWYLYEIEQSWDIGTLAQNINELNEFVEDFTNSQMCVFELTAKQILEDSNYLALIFALVEKIKELQKTIDNN